jgi:acetylornithine deacetylase/succinyl-diaminopimelate desuccinylase-like protein
VNIRAYVEADTSGFIADLREWLSMTSVSGDPRYADDVRRSAQWPARYPRETGFPVVEVWETPGLPSVFAEWPAEDPATPAHHDVQPCEPGTGCAAT